MSDSTARIVVGVDGSPASLDALRWAVRQADLTSAAVEVVITWHWPAAYGSYPLMAEIDWEGNARDTLATSVKDCLGDRVGDVAQRVVEGHPAKVLLDASAGADLLVVGSRGHGGFSGMLLGSVSEHVVSHAPCPVLVVRAHGADAA